MTTTSVRTKRLVGTSSLVAIIIALQSLSSFILPTPLPINLVLAPIIVGAAMYGALSGAALGLSFAFVVLLSGITGAAPLSFAMWSLDPVLMTVVTLARGAAIGLAAGGMYKLLAKKSTFLGVIAAGIVAPIVNTGIFITAVVLLFRSVLAETGPWADLAHAFDGGAPIIPAIAGFVGVNFVIELIVNIVLASAMVRIIQIAKKRRQ